MPARRSTKSSTDRRSEAYVDTSALIAFADRSDTHHARFRLLFSDPPPLVTTLLVLAEGHGWFVKRYDPARGLQFLAMIDAMPLTIVPVGPTEQRAAAALLRKFSDQDVTLTDAVGLHLMASRRIRVCWSTDFYLGLTKVPLVIHQ
jgi:predicted nucleic acid-binding protein